MLIMVFFRLFPGMSLLPLIFLLFLSSSVSSTDPPRMTEHPDSMTVARNEPVTLRCKARGEEPILYAWFRRGPGGERDRVRTAPEDPTSHRMLLPDGSLFFLSAKQNKKEQVRNYFILLFFMGT